MPSLCAIKLRTCRSKKLLYGWRGRLGLVSHTTREAVPIVMKTLCEPITIPATTKPLNHGELKYLFFSWASSLHPNSLLEAILLNPKAAQDFPIIMTKQNPVTRMVKNSPEALKLPQIKVRSKISGPLKRIKSSKPIHDFDPIVLMRLIIVLQCIKLAANSLLCTKI